VPVSGVEQKGEGGGGIVGVVEGLGAELEVAAPGAVRGDEKAVGARLGEAVGPAREVPGLLGMGVSASLELVGEHLGGHPDSDVHSCAAVRRGARWPKLELFPCSPSGASLARAPPKEELWAPFVSPRRT
jgi:hypothetical protein